MKRFSKNDNSAICNYCGKWQPTDLTNQQLEEMDWKCDECKAKEGTPEVEPTEQDRGSKEISKYDPEYEFLVKLVKLLVKEGVSPQEIKSIAESYPFVTIDDVGDLTAKLWTLATEKYKIPREWLIKRLPKNASLKTAKQYFGTNVLINPNVNQILNALKRSEFEGLRYMVDNQNNTYVWDASAAVHEDMGNALGLADFDGENIPEGPYATNAGYVENLSDAKFVAEHRPLAKAADLYPAQKETQDMIDHAPGYLAYQYGQDKESKNQSMSLVKAIEILNTQELKVIGINPKNSTITLADGSVLSFDDAAKKALELSKTSAFTGAEFSKNDVGVNPTMDIGPFSSPEDHGAKPQKQPFPNTGWLPADDENKDEQPYSNIASAFNPAFSKKAGLDSRYWIAPDGKEFNAGTHHGAWVNNNIHILKSYNIDTAKPLYEIYQQMFKSGWSRATNERGFTVQVPDLRKVPKYLDDFIAAHFKRGDTLRIGTETEMVEITNPFPSIQKAINRELTQARKQAALTPQAYWIDPKGTWYTVRGNGNDMTTHSGWARDNVKMLKEKYPELNIPKDTSRFDFYRALLQNGWVRIGDSRGASYQIQAADPLHLHPSIIDWVYQNVPNGSSIEIDDANGDLNSYISLEMPVENLEKEIANGLRRKKMAVSSLKEEADLGGRTVNQILNLFLANGGVTFNISKGNMVGTNNYAVAAYPERAEILPGIDFDKVEEYILKNEDLLNNPENSFGAWAHNGQVYLDIVATIPDVHKAIELGRQHNQIAIWDLKNGKEIPTGGTGEVKQAAQNPLLPQQLQDAIAAETSPVYNIALNNYAEAVKRGHEKDRSLKYAIESVSNLEQIDAKKLVELINKYL